MAKQILFGRDLKKKLLHNKLFNDICDFNKINIYTTLSQTGIRDNEFIYFRKLFMENFLIIGKK